MDSSSRGARGVLFDMDGVLVATEELKDRAHQETVRALGGRVAPETYFGLMGRAHEDVVRAYIRAAGLDVDEREYIDRFRAIYSGLLRDRLELVPGARDLLGALRRDGLRLALVSSSRRWMMDEIGARTGLLAFFDATVSADDVREEKPAPEPYRRALEGLALPAESAVVVEDTESGVESGRRAGLPVIAIRHAYNAHHDLSAAAAVLPAGDADALRRAIGSALASG